jgi:AraC-like DNA-binding protein
MSNFRHADDPEIRVRSFAVTYPHGGRKGVRGLAPPCAVDWHQLIYAVRGVVRVRTPRAAWMVPPHRALWVPAGTASALEMVGEVALRMLYVRTGPRGLPSDCGVVNVLPLLRELIVRVNGIGALDERRPEQGRLAGVVMDELRRLRTIPLQLPLPTDERAARFAQAAAERPQMTTPAAALARRSGASVRTLERLVREETGLSLGQWRRRHLLLHALALLAAEEPVGHVAAELGYSSASAFIVMFRRELGETPARYLAGAGAG